MFANQQRLGKFEFTEVRSSSRMICALRRFQLDLSLIKSFRFLNYERALLSLLLEMLYVAMANICVVAFTKSVLLRTHSSPIIFLFLLANPSLSWTREHSRLCGWKYEWLPWQLLLGMERWQFMLRMKRSNNFP